MGGSDTQQKILVDAAGVHALSAKQEASSIVPLERYSTTNGATAHSPQANARRKSEIFQELCGAGALALRPDSRYVQCRCNVVNSKLRMSL
jgi:hypothetical protein